MTKHRGFAFLLVMLSLLFIVPTAAAHRPAEADEEGITSVPNPTTSYAYYEALDGGSEVDVYAVAAEAGQFFHAGINIPQIEGLESYGVSLALLGPGLPAVDAEALPAVPHDHSEDAGEHSHNDAATWRERLGMDSLSGIVAPSETSEDFYEPFTQTNYWGRQVVQLDLPETGTYHLLVWNPSGETGKYVLDTGREEVFSASDLFRFPIWWVETHLYFENTVLLAAGAVGMLLLLGGAVFGWRRMAKRSSA